MTAVKGPDSTAENTLTRLVNQYQSALLRMCRICLRDASLAEDAVQETFLKAYRKLDTYRAASQEKTWLMSIALNTCRDMTRTGWFRRTERRFTPEDMTLPAPGPDEDALALAQAISCLPAKLRDVILLYYYQDMTIKEVAQTLHAAPSTIVKRLRQAEDKLRTALGEEEPAPAVRKGVF